MAAGNVKGGIQRDLQGDLDAIAQKAKDPEIKNFFNELAAGAGKAVVETAKLKAALLAIESSQKLLNVVFKEGVGALNTLETAQLELTKQLGEEAPAALNVAKTAFHDFNNSARQLGLTFDSVRVAVGATNAALKFTPIEAAEGAAGLQLLARSVAENANVFESTKLVDIIKGFTLQTKAGADSSRLFSEQLIETAVRAGLPRESLVGLSQQLLNTGVAFGSTLGDIQRLTFQTEAFGRALGTTGDAIRGQLSDMMTIGQRQQLAARLSQIGTMVGARVDISKLLSADPTVQQEGIREALQSFSQQYQQFAAPEQRRALFLALSRTLRLPARAIQTALESGADVSGALDKLAEKRAESEAGISEQTRIRFTKLTQRINELINAMRLQAGEAQLEVLRTTTNKLVNNSNTGNELLEDLNDNMTEFMRLMTKALKSVENTPEAKQLFAKLQSFFSEQDAKKGKNKKSLKPQSKR